MGLFQSEVESITKKLREAERELAETIRGRPALALEAERGKLEGLTKLDSRVAEIKQRVENLTDAVAAAKWQAKISAEQEVIPAIEARKAAGANLKKGLSYLVTAIKQVRNANAQLAERAKELGVRANGPDLLLATLVEVAVAFDIDGLAARIAELDARPRPAGFTPPEFAAEIARLKDGLGIEFPEVSFGIGRLHEEEVTLDALLAGFRERAKSPGPKKRMAPRPEDRGTGVLGAINAANRPAAGQRP
jgi:hypothetical protein